MYDKMKFYWMVSIYMHKVKNQKIIACKIATSLDPNTQVPSSDIITSLCGYSSVNEAWKVFVYVNGGASAIGDA